LIHGAAEDQAKIPSKSENRICTAMHSRQGGMTLQHIDPLFDARDSAFKDFEEKEETKKENGSSDVERRSRRRGRRSDD
jgi:hypothetical protein